MQTQDNKPSKLSGALRRLGGQLEEVVDVGGTFTPDKHQAKKGRVVGVFSTHDARLRIAFDREKVTLPALEEARLLVSGKIWLDATHGSMTLMVRFYRVEEPVNAANSMKKIA